MRRNAGPAGAAAAPTSATSSCIIVMGAWSWLLVIGAEFDR
eukprot:gene52742-24989_t